MRAKKSLGQNFLTNHAVIDKMIDSLELEKSDVVVEIGPGKGALTKKILEREIKKVVAIEKDERMIDFLQENLEKQDNLKLEHLDFLEWEPKEKPYKLIGNIPFYITGAILKHVFDNLEHPTAMTLLMQKEVAERMVLRDGKNSILGTAINIYSEPKLIATVKPGSFSPPPKVTSAVITFKNIKNPFKNRGLQEGFFDFLHKIFAGKRKTVTTNLKKHFSTEKILEALAKNNLDSKIRAEDMSPQEIFNLFIGLNPQTN